MKYVQLINNAVFNEIPEYDPALPGLPVTSRFAPDFLSQCVAMDESVETPVGYIYDPETGAFTAPPEPEPEPDPPEG